MSGRSTSRERSKPTETTATTTAAASASSVSASASSSTTRPFSPARRRRRPSTPSSSASSAASRAVSTSRPLSSRRSLDGGRGPPLRSSSTSKSRQRRLTTNDLPSRRSGAHRLPSPKEAPTSSTPTPSSSASSRPRSQARRRPVSPPVSPPKAGAGGDVTVTATPTSPPTTARPGSARSVDPPRPSAPSTTPSSASSSTNDNVRVVCRFRPLNEKERRETGSTCVALDPNGTSVEVVTPDGYSDMAPFHFDRVFGFESAQAEVYEYVGKPVVEGLFDGYNGTVFAYGQTSSGKTFTMEGPDIADDNLKGIIPRMVTTVFDKIEASPETVDFTLKISMVEIYMEKVRDLLDPARDNLDIREHKETGFFVDGLSEVFVTEPGIIFDIIRTGSENRATAATAMNAGSSRSHSVFIFTLIQKDLETLSSMSAKLYLVDLAGSEKVRKTGASGLLLEQAKKINWSLAALGNVINALTEGNTSHVPYRESKLTRLLKESLGGNSKTALVVNCSPSAYNRDETTSTLRFGVRAKRMVNKPKINKELSPAELKMMLELRDREIARLKARIHVLEGRLGSGAGASAGGGGRFTTSLSSASTTSTTAAAGSLPADIEARLNAADDLRSEIGSLQEQLAAEKEAREEVENQLEEMVSSFVTRVEGEKQTLSAQIDAERMNLQGVVAQLEDDLTQVRKARETADGQVADLTDEVTVLKASIAKSEAGQSETRATMDELTAELHVLKTLLRGGGEDAAAAAVPPMSPVDGTDLDLAADDEPQSPPPATELRSVNTPSPIPGTRPLVPLAVDSSAFKTDHASELAALVAARFGEAVVHDEARAERIDAAEQRATAAEGSLSELKIAHESTTALLREAQGRVESLETQRQEMQSNLATARADVQANTQMLTASSQRATALQSELDTVKAALRSAKSSLLSLEGQSETAQHQCTSLKAQVARLTEQYNVACRDRDRAVEAQTASNELAERLQTIAADAGRESTESDQRHKALSAQLESSQASLSAARQAADDSDRACETLRGEVSSLRDRLESTTAQVDDFRRKADVAEAELSVAITRATKAEAGLSTAESELRTKSRELDHTSAALTAQKTEVARLAALVQAHPAKLEDAVADATASTVAEWEENMDALETEWRAKRHAWERQHEEEMEAWGQKEEEWKADAESEKAAMEEQHEADMEALRQEYEKAAVEQKGVLWDRMEAAKTTEVAREVEATQSSAAKQLARLKETNDATTDKMRELKQELVRMRRQRNRAYSECSNRKLELDILRSTVRALEVRLEQMSREVHAAGMAAAAGGGGTGGGFSVARRVPTSPTPPSSPHVPSDVPADVAERIKALEATCTNLMGQVESKGSKIMDMEWREQKLLKDLRDRVNKVVELQVALDARDDQLRDLGRGTSKRERALAQSLEVHKRRVVQVEQANAALMKQTDEMARQLQLLEMKRQRSRIGSVSTASPDGGGGGGGDGGGGGGGGGGKTRLVMAHQPTSMRGGGARGRRGSNLVGSPSPAGVGGGGDSGETKTSEFEAVL